MSRKIVRNITDTKLKGKDKEPLTTNIQNDLLSDDENVYIRNKNEYHCLTDNIKAISITDNDLIKVNTTGKNTRRIDVTTLVTKIETLETDISNLETRIKDIEDLNLDSRITDIEDIDVQGQLTVLENRIIALEP